MRFFRAVGCWMRHRWPPEHGGSLLGWRCTRCRDFVYRERPRLKLVRRLPVSRVI